MSAFDPKQAICAISIKVAKAQKSPGQAGALALEELQSVLCDVTAPHQAAAISARDVKARARALMCLSNSYFFFFLPVFFFAFFAFLAFLAMFPSTIPKLLNASRLRQAQM